MDLGLEGKGVFVTGGSGGIGEALVAAFAEEGARVHFTFHTNADGAHALFERCGTEQPIQMNLADHSSVKNAFSSAEALGPIDVLVNNAVMWRPPADDEEAAIAMMRANIEAPCKLAHLAMASMSKRGWGRIISISSNIAEDGMAGSSPYSTAKAALHGLMASLKWDGGANGVLVNTIMPGLTLTKRAQRFIPEEVRENERQKTPSHRLSLPEDVAKMAVFLGSTANGNVTGQLLRVTGGR